MAAAVADYRPRYHYTEKIKREGQAEMELELVRNPDIAATLGARKRPEQFFVGFALESNAGVEEAKRKMYAKHFDAIVVNSLQDAGAGFAHETNKVTIFDREGSIEAYELKSKDAVAHPVDQGAVVQEQEHRRQEAREGCEQPQEAEALLHAVPRAEDYRQEGQDDEQDQEHEALHDLHRVRGSRDTKPCRQDQQVDAEERDDTNPR